MLRRIATLILFCTTLMTVFTSQATVTGWCTPTNGPHNYSFPINVTLNSINDTHVGDIYPESWDLGSHYTAMCDTTPGVASDTLFKGEPGSANTDLGMKGDEHYFMLAGTDETLSVTTNIELVDGSTYSGFSAHNVPFTNKSNHKESIHNPVSGNINDCPDCLDWSSGSRGNIKIRVEKRITEPQITIPGGTIVASLYASHTDGSYGSTPMSYVTIGGTITVPQGCELNIGDTITINLPDAWANDFTTVGQMPQNYTPAAQDVEIHCSNVAMTQELQLGLRTSSVASGMPDTIQSSNENIGVKLSVTTPVSPEKNIVPNDATSRIPFYLDKDNGFAHVMLKAWPVKTQDVMPAPGLFTARATLDVYYP